MSNPLQIPDRDNELLREADEYLRKHKILELFEVHLVFLNLIFVGLDDHHMLQAAREH